MSAEINAILVKCECGAVATSVYAPSSDNPHPYYCDDCVPRGCSCRIESTEFPPPPHCLNIKWHGRDRYELLDEMGRSCPCVEYDHYPDGFDEHEESKTE